MSDWCFFAYYFNVSLVSFGPAGMCKYFCVFIIIRVCTVTPYLKSHTRKSLINAWDYKKHFYQSTNASDKWFYATFVLQHAIICCEMSSLTITVNSSCRLHWWNQSSWEQSNMRRYVHLNAAFTMTLSKKLDRLINTAALVRHIGIIV